MATINYYGVDITIEHVLVHKVDRLGVNVVEDDGVVNGYYFCETRVEWRPLLTSATNFGEPVADSDPRLTLALTKRCG